MKQEREGEWWGSRCLNASAAITSCGSQRLNGYTVKKQWVVAGEGTQQGNRTGKREGRQAVQPGTQGRGMVFQAQAPGRNT